MKMKKKVLISMLAVTATLALGAFMGGCSLSDKIEQWRCDHENITENVVIDPTCYEKGELKETCDDCGKTWTEDIEKVAHTWNDGEVVVEATCTETGITRYTCTVEGCEAVEDRVTDKVEHTRVEMPAVAPTCDTVGYTEWYKCGDCGLVLTKKQELPALGHVETELKAVAPTCTETGLTAGVGCATCGEVITAQTVVPATGHNIVTVAGKPATCTETGLTNGQACEDCGKVFVEQTEIPALGHVETELKAVAPTCTETGLTAGVGCATCGEVITAQTAVPATGHIDNNVDGICEVCNEEGAMIMLQAYANNENVVETDYIAQESLSPKTIIRVYKPTNISGYLIFYSEGDDLNLFLEPIDSDKAAFCFYTSLGGEVISETTTGDFVYIEYDEYIDFYFDDFEYTVTYLQDAVGSDINGNPITVKQERQYVVTFTGNFTISSMSSTSNVSVKILSMGE